MNGIFRSMLTLGILWSAGVAATAAMKQSKEKDEDNPKNNSHKNNHVDTAAIKDSKEDDIPEFEKYSGHKVSEVEELLNSVTHSGPYDHILRRNYFHISRQDFAVIKKKLGVSEIYLRDNYDPFCYCGRDHYDYGDMITFRIRDEYAVSNDGFIIIDGKWRYFTVDEVREDYIRQAQCKGRTITPDRCCII